MSVFCKFMCVYPLTIVNKRKQTIMAQMVDLGLEVSDDVLSLPDTVTVPCGKCYECMRSLSLDWAYRCAIESRYYDKVCMVTLTYKETDGNLCKRDVQLFLKRLRKKYNVRYFGCGEYGSKGLRPHYHLILFGYLPNDLKFFYRERNGQIVYLSDELANFWKLGFVSVIKGFDLSASIYTSLYLQKAQIDLIRGKVKPFRLMSRRPGIGGDSLAQCDIETDSIYINGKRRRIPRYLLLRFESLGFDLSLLRDKRLKLSDIFFSCSSPLNLKFRRKKQNKFLYERFFS